LVGKIKIITFILNGLDGNENTYKYAIEI